jgi:hypothetical protein
MSDKLLLYVPFAIQVQMEVDGGGLDVVMAQVVFNVRYGMAGVEHIHSACMTEAVNRIDCLEPFRGKGPREIFFADPIDAMPSQFLPPLVNEEPIFIRRSRFYAVFVDIAIKKLRRFGLKLYEPEAVSFSQDGQCILPWIEVLKI